METEIIPFNYGPCREIILLFPFLVLGTCPAPPAILFQINFAVNAFFILFVAGRPIVGAFALSTVEFN